MPGPMSFVEGKEGPRCESGERERSKAPVPLHTPFLPINNPKCHFKGDRELGEGLTGRAGWGGGPSTPRPPPRQVCINK